MFPNDTASSLSFFFPPASFVFSVFLFIDFFVFLFFFFILFICSLFFLFVLFLSALSLVFYVFLFFSFLNVPQRHSLVSPSVWHATSA